MVNFYIFNEKKDSCVVFEDTSKATENEIICSEGILPLTLQRKNAFQWVYKHQDAILIIEKQGDKVITATLKNVNKNQSLGTILNYYDGDWGQAVYDVSKQGYILKYGLPKIFHLFKNDYDPDKEWSFYFNHEHHLVLKDKDKHKPHYWYQFDYTPELSQYIFDVMSIRVKPEQGEIVAIPGELGDACRPWVDNNYGVNYFYCGYDPDNTKYDFSKETPKNWQKNNSPTGLVITFLPTYFQNHLLPEEHKLTGTNWFIKIWEVFGSEGVPIVLKAYPGFIYKQLYKNYPSLYNRISAITELPTSIDNREVGKANILVYFNCPFLGDGVADRVPYIT